jgi:hypothetical protein
VHGRVDQSTTLDDDHCALPCSPLRNDALPTEKRRFADVSPTTGRFADSTI